MAAARPLKGAAWPLKGTAHAQGPGSHLVRFSPCLLGVTVPPAHLTHTPELLRPWEPSLDTPPRPAPHTGPPARGRLISNGIFQSEVHVL